MVNRETDPVARNEHIYNMVGIEPDQRFHIPAPETAQLIRGVQAGDAAASERLLATRLIWIYDKFAGIEGVQRRYDLELTDIMQIGCMATLQAAQAIRFEKTVPPEMQLKIQIPRHMSVLIMRSKLIPTITHYSVPTYNVGGIGGGISRALLNKSLPDNAAPVPNACLGRGLYEDRTSLPDSVENNSGALLEIAAVLDPYIEQLPAKQQRIVRDYFGLQGHAKKLLEIAKEEGCTKQAVHVMLHKALTSLKENVSPQDEITLRSYLDDDQTNESIC
ncbi:MAG TPA: sigma factor-like helix-turn-helix DNA-binding protein [Candidatus Saccharimonadales bacterium]